MLKKGGKLASLLFLLYT